jgi:hypothetical protein
MVMLIIASVQFFFAMCMIEVFWDVALCQPAIVIEVPKDRSLHLQSQVYYLTVKIQAVQSFDMLVTIYQ